MSHKSGSSNPFVSAAAAMISFVNPDLLGSLSTFKRVFAEPISKSQERDSTAEEQALGTERSKYAPIAAHTALADLVALEATCIFCVVNKTFTSIEKPTAYNSWNVSNIRICLLWVT